MRQTFFRGKCIAEKKWYEGNLIIEDENNCFIVGNEFGEVQVEPESVGEFTGTHAPNGNQVMEGDIVWAEILGGGKQKLIIAWGERGFVQIDEQGYRYTDWFPVIEVIGNIHDTPDFTLPKVRNEEPQGGNDPWRCEVCGSLEVQQQGWVDPTTGKVVSYNDCDRGDYWCDHCCEHNYIVRESELMKDIEEWWQQTDFETMEIITGLQEDDYDPADGSQAFVDACEQKWNALGVEEKIHIWYESTRDKSEDN
jgi:hypothetical protein